MLCELHALNQRQSIHLCSPRSRRPRPRRPVGRGARSRCKFMQQPGFPLKFFRCFACDGGLRGANPAHAQHLHLTACNSTPWQLTMYSARRKSCCVTPSPPSSTRTATSSKQIVRTINPHSYSQCTRPGGSPAASRPLLRPAQACIVHHPVETATATHNVLGQAEVLLRHALSCVHTSTTLLHNTHIQI